VSTHHATGREITTVLVRMRDDELIEGVLTAFDLDQPDFELTPTDPGSNDREVLIPFESVKSIVLQRRRADGDFSSNGHVRSAVHKVVIRFWDGEIRKGFIHRAPIRCHHGVQIELLNVPRDTIEVLAIPHSAVKGVFYVKSWDGRAGEFVRETGNWKLHQGDTSLLDLLGEIRSLDRLRGDGRLSDEEFERKRRFVLDRI
jgi:hypothetical protein